MLTGHSEFYLSQPIIYFGELRLSEDDLLEEKAPFAEFQLNPYFPLSIEPKTGMYIEWYDLPN